jgi:hypothetical protein
VARPGPLDRPRRGIRAARLEARRRHGRPHGVAAPEERRVDPGPQTPAGALQERTAGHRPDRLSARRRADRGRQGPDRRGRAEGRPRGAAQRSQRRGRAIRRPGVRAARLAQGRPGLRRPRGPQRQQAARGVGQGGSRADPQRQVGRRPQRLRDGQPRGLRRLRGGLRRGRRQAPGRDRRAGRHPAAADLPGAADRDRADPRRRLRLHRRAGPDLPVRRLGRDRDPERDVDPGRPDVRGGDRLLPAAGFAVSRGAAPLRGQARSDAARARTLRAGDPGQRPDGHRVDARPARGGGRRRPLDGPGVGDRRRLRAARRPDAAAGAAHDLRPPGLLAAAADRRLRPRTRARGAPGHLAPDRGSRAPAPRPRADRDGGPVRRGRARPAGVQGELLDDDLLQEADGVRGRLQGDGEVGAGRQPRPDQRADRPRGRSGPAVRRRGGARGCPTSRASRPSRP